MKLKLNDKKTYVVILIYNVIISIILLLLNFEKIFIEKFWLNFIFILMFLWNLLLLNFIKNTKNEKN